MKTSFSKSWKSSKQPRKQRKYLYNAPLHTKSKMLSSPLSKELKGKYKIRNVRPVKEDKVKIMVGQYKDKSGKIERLDLSSMKAYINGIEMIKKDGNKVLYPIHVSNLEVIELNLNDKKRKAILERNSK